MHFLEAATLHVLEQINTRFVCTHCQNSGGEGKHTQACEFYAVLTAWRARHPESKQSAQVSGSTGAAKDGDAK